MLTLTLFACKSLFVFVWVVYFVYCAQQADLFWVQEEPQNMGAWSYIEPRFRTMVLWVGACVRILFMSVVVASARVPVLSG